MPSVGQFLISTKLIFLLSIETQNEIGAPEVQILPNNEKASALNIKIKISGMREQTVKFKIPVPLTNTGEDGENMIADEDFLRKSVSVMIKTVSSPSPTLTALIELASDESNTIVLAEVIANTVGAIIEQNQWKASVLEVKIETKSDVKTPKIDINKGKSQNVLQTVVILPRENDKTVTFSVPVTLKKGINNRLPTIMCLIFDINLPSKLNSDFMASFFIVL